MKVCFKKVSLKFVVWIYGHLENNFKIKSDFSKSFSDNFLISPGWDSNPGSGERQIAVNGDALDHTAIRGKAIIYL